MKNKKTIPVFDFELGDKEKEYVNFERALCVGSELGGHFVSGHISTCAVLKNKKLQEKEGVFTFSLSKKWSKYLVPKTHIAINGVSLTLVEIILENEDDPLTCLFSVHLIPMTLKRTTFNLIQEKSFVNIEFNTTVKTILQTLENMKSQLHLNNQL